MEHLECIYIKTLSNKAGNNPRYSILVERNFNRFVLNLWEPWTDLGDYLVSYTKIRVLNVKRVETGDSFFYSADKSSIVIVDPDILVNASSLSNISFCPRSFYINQVIGDSPSPYVAVRGTIVHNALGAAISSRSKPSKVLSEVIDSYALHIEQLNYSSQDVYQDTFSMAESLDPFVEELSVDSSPEVLFLSPILGVRGRIDLLSQNKIYELKTANVSEDDRYRFSDLMQVAVYRFGINGFDTDFNTDSNFVLYVGSGSLVKKQLDVNWGVIRFAMEMRNLAYRISYLGFIPPVLSEENINKCSKCSVKVLCSILCAGLNHQRTCPTCPHETFCSKKALNDNYIAYFERYTNLIRKEKNESKRNLADLWNLSIEERVEKGKTITNLSLENQITEDGVTTFIFSCENKSELREGDIVLLSDAKVVSNPVITGVISRITENIVEIETRAAITKINSIDVYYNDISYRRQQRGLFHLIFKRNNFTEYIVNGKKSTVIKQDGMFIRNNNVQNEAIQKILGTEGFCLIQGPAGTGKTHVIAKAAITLANKKEKLLLTAFTNRAVDNMASYLIDNGFKDFIRLGSSRVIDDNLSDNTLSAMKDKTNLNVKQLLMDIPILLATTSTISSPIFEKLGFQTIIVDEASQMTEPNLLSAILEGDRCVLVGDHKQLPPVVQSQHAQNEGLGVSLFERLANKHRDTIHLLTHQFRMNEKLMEFSNQVFYDGKLRAFDKKVSSQNLSDLVRYDKSKINLEHINIYLPEYPLVFIPVRGDFVASKKMNVEEAEVVAKVIKGFFSLGISRSQLGVIAPYRGQVGEIRRLAPSMSVVDTVDRFQGSDREIIMLSLTETETKGNVGFSDPRRLNVAITRAKKKLVIVGNPEVRATILQQYVSYLKEQAENILIKEVIPIKKERGKPKQQIVIVADSISKAAKFIQKIKAKGKGIIKTTDTKNICIICSKPVYEKGVECPLCNKIFHFKHLVAWVKQEGRCPYCKTSLTIFEN